MPSDPIRQVEHEARDHMARAVEATRGELASIRSGRANPALLDHLTVEYFDSTVPIKQVAGISAPEPRLLVITPWDKTVIPAIRKAITSSDLGINPVTDGNVIRLPLPALTEERRRDLVKLVGHVTEEGRVAVRNARRDVIERLRKMDKAHDISEDDRKRAEAEVQKSTDQFIKELDALKQAKEAELMEV